MSLVKEYNSEIIIPRNFQTGTRLKQLPKKDNTVTSEKGSLELLFLYSGWLITFTHDIERYEEAELQPKKK